MPPATARKPRPRSAQPSAQPSASDAIRFPRKPWDHNRECLTPAGKRFLEPAFETFGSGVGLLRMKYPWVYDRATGAGMTLPEIESICYEAAVKCVRLFEPSKGRFSTYYGNSMWRNLWGEVQKIYERNVQGDKGRGERGDDLDNHLAMLSEDEARLRAGRPDEREESEMRDNMAYVHEILARANLTERERSILNLRYGLSGGTEHALHEIGDRYGVSKERIRQIQMSVLRKLRSNILGQ